MSKEMSKDVQKKLLLLNATLSALVAYVGEETVYNLVQETGLNDLLDDMEAHFGKATYDVDVLYSIIGEMTEELQNFKEE